MIRFINIGLPLLRTGVSAEIFQPAILSNRYDDYGPHRHLEC